MSEPGTVLAFYVILLLALAAFFVLRPGLWRLLCFSEVDPRPAGLMRIAFGALLIWSWAGLFPDLRTFFTDEGIWLPEQARAQFARELSHRFDAQEGFESFLGFLHAALDSFSVLHLRADPPFVTAIWSVMMVALALMTVGLFTRTATLCAWLAMHQLYGFSTIFFSSADFAIRSFFFLALFLRWGEVYSLDALRRSRPRAMIPGWPLRLMMVQLAVLYCATGLLKSGYTWRNGTALYYAMNLDHFYRYPAPGLVAWLQETGLLVWSTRLVRLWEVFFPVALLGAVLRARERALATGTWPRPGRARGGAAAVCLAAAAAAGVALARTLSAEPSIPVVLAILSLATAAALRFSPRTLAWATRWLLGRRIWLGFGLAMHLGIELTMNVGSFSKIMLVAYLPWLRGEDVPTMIRWFPRRRAVSTRSSTSRADSPSIFSRASG